MTKPGLKEFTDKLMTLHSRIFGRKHLRLKAAGAVSFLVIACMATMGTLTYIGVIDQSRYEVSGLTIKQNGTSLDVSWDEENCDGYEVFLFQNGERPKSITAKTNKCKIELDKLDEKYRVVVTAKSETGGVTGAASKKVYAEKIEQPIEVVKEAFAGFEGSGASLKADAPEEIKYKSSNDKVVSVSENGTLEYKEPGEAEISVIAEEGEKYKEGEKTVDVTVFPDRLSTPEGWVAETKDTTVTLQWKPVEFAQKYSVLKKSPVDGTYSVLEEKDAETFTAELPRAQATYAIVATAEVEGQMVDGNPSKDIKVASPAETAETYDSYHELKSLDSSNLELIAEISGIGAARTPQSMSFVNGNYVVAFSNSSDSAGALVKYDIDGNRIDEREVSDLGHGNGSTYNPYTEKIYTVKTHRGNNTPSCTMYNPDLSSAGTFDLPKNTAGIAYDETSNKYYLAKGNEIYVTDSEFNVEHFYWKKIRYHHAQDIAASDGVIVVCTWVKGNESYLDLYRASDGEYIGGYTVNVGEIESALVVDKHLVLLINNFGGAPDQILRTTEPVALP